jgi:predicted transposase YdaD
MKKSQTIIQKKKMRLSGDNICKFLAEKNPIAFIKWILHGQDVGEIKILKTELQRESIRADAAYLVELLKKIFHLEFQTTIKSNPPIEIRMLDYHVGFKRVFLDYGIKQFLIVLKDTGEPIPDRYEDEDIFFRYTVIKMWEQSPQELMKDKVLLPLSVLCKTDGDEKKLLRDVAKKISEVKDIDERRELTEMTSIFAGLRFPKDLIYQMLRRSDMLEESVIVQDWVERGLQKGLQQGLQQGLHRGEAQIVLLQIEKLFGKISVKTRRQIENLPIKKIESLSKALLDFESKKELTDWLAKHSK